LLFHAVQDGIKRAGAQPIPVPTELVDHRLAENGAFGGVVENMQPDESRIQVSIYHRFSPSDSDIEIRAYTQSSAKVKVSDIVVETLRRQPS